MAERSRVGENGHASAAGRDAWAVDGFAPLPGDALRLPESAGGGQATVQTVYLCSEADGSQLVRWSWIVLEGGRLLEIAPRGCALYEPPTVLPHGSLRFLELAAQDGALVRFEERVRAGEWQARPVRLTLNRRRWRVTSTGTVTAQRLGAAPEGALSQLRTGSLPSATTATSRAAIFAQVDDAITRDAERGVYFTLAGESDADALGLGIWMTDIALAFGHRLGDRPAAAGLSTHSE